MTDCYRILGVPRHASAREIRAAFLAKMKALHPDARRGDEPVEGEAGEISSAYWQLRDAGRRAAHDLALFGGEQAPLTPPAPARVPARRSRQSKPRSSAPAKPAPKVGEGSARPRQSRRLQPLRAAAGVAACLIAAAGFVIAYSYLDPATGAQARTASLLNAPAMRRTGAAPQRRGLDPALAAAASQTFRETMRRAGHEGAHDYAQQCLLELASRPTMTMLDYCIAFDDRAADWEAAQTDNAAVDRHYFAEGQRFGRYRRVARLLKSGVVRDAMLTEIAFFADSKR